jgi:hypothetical protein
MASSGLLVHKRTMPIERPPFIGESSVNFRGYRASSDQRSGFPRPLISVSPATTEPLCDQFLAQQLPPPPLHSIPTVTCNFHSRFSTPVQDTHFSLRGAHQGPHQHAPFSSTARRFKTHISSCEVHTKGHTNTPRSVPQQRRFKTHTSPCEVHTKGHTNMPRSVPQQRRFKTHISPCAVHTKGHTAAHQQGHL